MENAIKDDVHWRMLRLRSQLVSEQIGYSAILLNLKLVQTNSVTTLAVDGVSIYYNADFVSTMSDTSTKTSFLHECGHVIFKHHLRRGNRDPRLWNIAGDYVINWWLHKNGHRIPSDWLLDIKYAGMVTEQVYAQLKSEGVQPEENPSEGQDTNTTGDCKKDDLPENISDSPTDVTTGNENTAVGKPEEFDQVGEVWDYPGEEGEAVTQEDRDRAEAEIADAIASSAMIEKMAGKGNTGAFGEVIEANARSQILWSDLLRDHMVSTVYNETSYQRFNRQHVGRGIYLPGEDRSQGGTVHVSIDSSASVSREEFEATISEIESICDETGIDTLYYSYFVDTMVKHGLDDQEDDWWIKCDIGAGERPKFRRVSGGTEFDCIFGSIEYLGHEPQCLVIVTDGCGWTTKEGPNYPVIWATTGAKPTFTNGEFGETVLIDINQERK